MILQQLGTFGNRTYGTNNEIPFNFGASGSPISLYNSTFTRWQGELDKQGGYSGTLSTDPGAVNNNDPKLLKRLIKD